MKRGKRESKSEYSKRKRSILVYGLGTLGLVLLVTAAFFGPQIVFAVQDDIRCGATVSMSPEDVDITSFNTGYEPDLYKRLNRFAEGLAEGRQYYVTVQDMELTSEVADWMTSDRGYAQESFMILAWDFGLIPEEVFGYNLISWKRCVIYGDDFAEGVNFILWYLELGNNDEPVVRLLVDGETGEIYGIRTNFDPFFQNGEDIVAGTLVDFYGLYDTNMLNMSIVLGTYYGGLGINDMLNWLGSMNISYYMLDGTLFVEVPEDYDAMQYQYDREQMEINLGKTPDYEWMNRYSVEEVYDLLQRLQWRIGEEGNCMDFDFPYNENILKFRIRLDGKIRWFKKWETRFLDITFGFPEIYERIPAFMADWS